jgi:sugar phosphate isomerase/epimerase
MKKAGMIFSYHNHAHEFEKLGDKHFMQAILENSDTEALKITADVYWLHYAGLNECKWLEENAQYISCTHFKDMGVHKSEQAIVEIMSGNLDYPKILETCKKIGIEYNFVELDTTRIDAFDAMKISYDNLMTTGYFEK